MEIGTLNYNEALEAGVDRGFYGPLLATLGRLAPEMDARRARADGELRRLGATFLLPGEGEDRVLPADWVPRLIPRDHWERLSAGVSKNGDTVASFNNGHRRLAPGHHSPGSRVYRRYGQAEFDTLV